MSYPRVINKKWWKRLNRNWVQKFKKLQKLNKQLWWKLLIQMSIWIRLRTSSQWIVSVELQAVQQANLNLLSRWLMEEVDLVEWLEIYSDCYDVASIINHSFIIINFNTTFSAYFSIFNVFEHIVLTMSTRLALIFSAIEELPILLHIGALPLVLEYSLQTTSSSILHWVIFSTT